MAVVAQRECARVPYLALAIVRRQKTVVLFRLGHFCPDVALALQVGHGAAVGVDMVRKDGHWA